MLPRYSKVVGCVLLLSASAVGAAPRGGDFCFDVKTTSDTGQPIDSFKIKLNFNTPYLIDDQALVFGHISMRHAGEANLPAYEEIFPVTGTAIYNDGVYNISLNGSVRSTDYGFPVYTVAFYTLAVDGNTFKGQLTADLLHYIGKTALMRNSMKEGSLVPVNCD